MAIVRPEQMDFSGKKFSALLYGSPGVGKTTLACSAPDPVLIDFDRGISRVRAQHRVPTIMCDKYEDALTDIKSPEMAEFQTIVIDTGGSFVTFLKDWALRTKPSAKLKSGEFNSLKGFGFVKSEFGSFTDYVKTVLNKNVIYVFHSQEQKDKDGNPTQRLMCEGSVRNTVWNPCDFGGYVQMIGSSRVICFSPEQEFFAKGTSGISGRYDIPYLDSTAPNDFMTKLFDQARANIAREKELYAPQREQYELVMAQVKGILNGVTDAQTANDAVERIPGLAHALTSKAEASAMLKAKTDALGLRYSKAAGGYTAVQMEGVEMERYLITQSLLSSWGYLLDCGEGWGDDAREEFLSTLNRERKPPTPAMQNGLDFETEVYKAAAHAGRQPHPKWEHGIQAAAGEIEGAQVQVKAKRDIRVDGMDFLVFGILDALKAGTIYDVKLLNKSFGAADIPGKYLESPQHPAYFYIVPEASEFCYLVSDGEEIYKERYRREDTPFIGDIISPFIRSIKDMGLLDRYKEKWLAL